MGSEMCIRDSAIATRQRHDGFLSAIMADNTAQIQQPKKKCRRKWTEGETTSFIDLLEERPYLWNIFEKSYHSRETREQGFEELQSTLNISMVDIKAKIVSLRAQLGREIAKTREQGFEELRHVAMNVACVWPARSITVATSCVWPGLYGSDTSRHRQALGSFSIDDGNCNDNATN